MDPFIIAIVFLLVSPVLAYMLLWAATKKRQMLRPLVIITASVCLLTIAGLLTKISTVSQTVNWFLLGFLYFGACLAIWGAWFFGNAALKVLGVFAIFVAFIPGYFLSTVGAPGLGYMVNDNMAGERVWLTSNRLRCETSIGNTLSSNEYKKVEIYKKVGLFPFLVVRENMTLYSAKMDGSKMIWTEVPEIHE